MQQILDPATGMTLEHEAMLRCVDRWLSDQAVLRAAIPGRSQRSLVLCLAAVRQTLDPRQAEVTIDATRAARLVHDLLSDKPVRKAIIRLEMRTRQGLDRRGIVQGLREARLHAKSLAKECAT